MMNRRAILAAPGLLAGEMGAAHADGLGPAWVELRNYETQPGQRDTLIAMFEAHFLDVYQAAGAAIVGTFRNLDDPNRWVWLRQFPSNATRATALSGFYGSARWQKLRGPAKATIRDVSDALLLVGPQGQPIRAEAPPAGEPVPASIFECARYFPKSTAASEHVLSLLKALPAQRLDATRAAPFTLTSYMGANAYPRQHLRPDLAIVVLELFADTDAAAVAVEARAASRNWRAQEAEIGRLLAAPVERLRLQPTSRSGLR
jgi:hypothetical protein